LRTRRSLVVSWFNGLSVMCMCRNGHVHVQEWSCECAWVIMCMCRNDHWCAWVAPSDRCLGCVAGWAWLLLRVVTCRHGHGPCR
jgi:hypothetical protein